MKNQLKIVFMGTPDFAVATLKTLVENNYSIVGVITAPDKPAGRGRKLQESAVKRYAKEKGLNTMQPTNLKNETFLEALKALQANLQIVVAFRMLPEAVWKLPKYGTFNLHASLLPDYRGAAPINWAIINGETKTGVSTFFIDENIDTGAMILQESISINETDDAGILHDKLMVLGSQLVLKTVKLIEKGTVSTTPQVENNFINTAYKLNKDSCKIDWEKPINTIYNKIRGLSPYPGAWTTLYNGDSTLEAKIYSTTPELATHSISTGTLITDKKSLKVAVSEGYIIINEIQLPGKRKMAVTSLLNGFHFEAGAKML